MVRPTKSNISNKFMDALKEKLLLGYAPGTVTLYLTKLRVLNGDAPFTSLVFLKDYEKIIERLNAIENLNTRKSYITAVVSIIGSVNTTQYNKINAHYIKLLNDFKINIYNKMPVNEKTETQSENWLNWKEVLVQQATLQKQADLVTAAEIKNNNPNAIASLERNLLLNFYTQIPPRRNNDFYLLRYGTGGNESNWYNGDTFTFNIFKTARKRGTEVITVTPGLKTILDNYIKIMGIKLGEYILFSSDTKRVNPSNMTKMLNTIFGRKIGVSMLRHIWNSHLLGHVLPLLKSNADALSHSVATDVAYIKV